MNELDLKAYKVTMFLNSIMVFFLPFILVIHTYNTSIMNIPIVHT